MKKTFKKGSFPLYLLMAIMLFSITLPLFYFSLNARDINTTKKILQEAAFTGALAASQAPNISAFENANERGDSTPDPNYPIDSTTGSPVTFLLESAAIAEAKAGVEQYLSNELPKKYSKNDYTIETVFSRVDIKGVDKNPSGPRNQIEVIVKLDYKPLTFEKSIRTLLSDTGSDTGKIFIGGKSIAKSKSLL